MDSLGNLKSDWLFSIQVIDANDHKPQFDRASYETSVEEGHVESQPILTVVAHDKDEGVNARIRYSWWPDFERFGPETKLLLGPQQPLLTDEVIASTIASPVSPEQLMRLQALPTYWFRLNEWTGEIFVHRALDYETRRGFVFVIIATNPDAGDYDGGDENMIRTSPQNSPSMTKVAIHVSQVHY